MKICPIKQYNLTFGAKNKKSKTQVKVDKLQREALKLHSYKEKAYIQQINSEILKLFGTKFDDINSLSTELLHLEDYETIRRYAELKKAHFSRRLTDDEAWILARPYSLEYADYCETSELYVVRDIALREKKAAKKFNTRLFTNEEIETFILLKDSPEFDSVNQITRYIALMAEDNGLPIAPTELEAKYFAKKCSTFDEIKEFYEQKAKSVSMSALSGKYQMGAFFHRTRQTDGLKETGYVAMPQNQELSFAFVDGKLTSVSKSYREDNETVNYNATKRLTTFANWVNYDYKGDSVQFLRNIIEVLNDEAGQPNRIIKTTFDEKDYVVNSKVYVLSDYPQELDVLGLVKKDSIKPNSETTTKFINLYGHRAIVQKFKTQNATLDRFYKENENGWELSLIIKDLEGNVLYKTERKFEKLDQNTTLTTVNGKKYIAIAQDEEQKIVVRYENGKEYRINGLIDNDVFYDDDVDSDSAEELWQYCKNNIPADLLIILGKLQTLLSPVKNELDSECGGVLGGIFTGKNAGVLAHEVGHLLSRNNYDFSQTNKTDFNYISDNEELRAIYQKELEEFDKNHSRYTKTKTLGYFDETGGTKDKNEETDTTKARSKSNREALEKSTGLEELVAETMYIKTIPNAKNAIIAMRTHFLMMNFPRTIAYISNLIDKNCANVL